MNLYQLAGCMKSVEDEINNGASPEEVAAALESIEADIKTKCVQVAYFIRNLSADVESLKAEEARLSKRRKEAENHIERLKQYLADGMAENSLTTTGDGIISVTRGKPKPALIIDSEDDIPDQYRKIKTESSFDRKALLDDLKAGQEIPGASVGESKPSITIK